MRVLSLLSGISIVSADFEYFVQPLQHGVENSPTFRQKYSYTPPKDKNGPMMVYIGGEGPMAPLSPDGLVASMAADFNGSILAVEHRFYGDSLPENPDDSDVMKKGLYSEYAMMDLVSLIKAKQTHPKQPVIVFGCSYPGMLSAWMRLNYPDLITGAVSSSAPIIASPSFPQFDRAIADVYGPECTKSAYAVLAAVERALDKDPQKIGNFLGCPTAVEQLGSDAKDRDNLILGILHAISEYYVYPVQNDNGVVKNEFCKIMNTGYENMVAEAANRWQSTPEDELEAFLDSMLLDTMAQMMRWEEGWKKRSCDAQNMMLMTSENAKKERTKEQPQGGALAKLRAWNFQSCAEFGFWQITNEIDASKIARSSRLTVKGFYEKACELEFGGNWPAEELTAVTNNRYRGLDIVSLPEDGGLGVTNIHFTNGNADPWAQLGMLQLPKSLLARYSNDEGVLRQRRRVSMNIIEQGSHCMDFGKRRRVPYNSFLEKSIGIAQDDIQHAIQTWLESHEAFQKINEIRI